MTVGRKHETKRIMMSKFNEFQTGKTSRIKKKIERSFDKTQNTIEHTLDKTKLSFAQKVKKMREVNG